MESNRQEAEMPRTILVHLNVELPEGRDDVGPDEVADAILGALEVGGDDEWFRYRTGFATSDAVDLASGNNAPIVVALAEEV